MREKLQKYLNERNTGFFDIFTRMTDDMPGGFFIYQAVKEEKVIHINKAALNIFGCDDFEDFCALTGGTFPGMVHPDDIDEVEKSIAEQIQTTEGHFDYVEYRIKQKNGSTRWIADYGHFIKTEPLGDIFYVFIVDATARTEKRMEQLEKVNRELMKSALRESRYRKAMQNDAVFFFEAGLTDNVLISDVTAVPEKYSFNILKSINIGEGSKFSEYTEGCADRLPERDAERFRDFFNKDRLIKCAENSELEQVCNFNVPDIYGSEHLLRFTVLLSSGEKNGISALILAKDITKQVQQNKLMEVSVKQAHSASVAKSAFLSGISHDVRTPLNAILGFADLIQSELEKNPNTGNIDTIKQYADKIKSSGRELLSIMNEALEVTRAESGKVILSETECHLEDVILSITKAVKPVMEAKNLSFNADFNRITHHTVFADVLRLQEILTQLLDNAAKYNRQGGRVSLSVEEKASSGKFAEFTFTVSDNGAGISEEFMPHLFEPFARENSTTEGGVSGAGLGLALVKSLLDLMEGSIEITSREGEGTTVTVKVVLHVSEESERTEPASHITSLNGLRALLAEDNELNREIAQALLEQAGVLIDTAANGEEAVEKIKSSSAGYYDFVLMDIQMPKMDGYDATRAIRALPDESLGKIPIIALSANAYSEDMKKSLDAGMDAHEPKPLDMNSLQETILTILNRNHLRKNQSRGTDAV